MKILVTGGGGFLGSEIVRLCKNRGDDVRIVARSQYPEIEALGCEAVQGDLADFEVAEKAVADCDAVINTAAKAGVWGPRSDYERANITTTENLLKAMQKHGTPYFIHTSTPSVTFDGTNVENGAQDLPYPTTFASYYAETKSIAEKMALSASMKVTALRPHLIYGPGDPHLLPRVLDRHRSGQLKRVGNGENRVDITYVTNAAWSHLDALDAFARGEDDGNGRAFFVSDDHPVKLWSFIDQIATELGHGKIPGNVSHGVARFAGAVLEGVHKTFRPSVEPRMTRFVADQLSTSHWYDMTPLKEAFGYFPRVSFDDAVQATVEDLTSRGYSTRPS